MIIEINSHLFCATMMNFCLIVNENEPPVCVYDDIYKFFAYLGYFFCKRRKEKIENTHLLKFFLYKIFLFVI